MKVRGDFMPSNAFTVEERPKRPGYALVRFFENAKPFEETQGDLTIRGYEYDEYHLELPYYSGLADDVLGNFDSYLTQAKLIEAQENTIPQLEQQIADLGEQNAALVAQLAEQDDTLIELYEMIGG